MQTHGLACANNCVFCHHHTNPVATFSRKIDSPEFLVEQALEKHRRMTYDCSIRGRSRGYAAPLRAEPRRGANDLRRDQQILRTPPPEPHRTVYEQTTGMGGERKLPPYGHSGGGAAALQCSAALRTDVLPPHTAAHNAQHPPPASSAGGATLDAEVFASLR